MITNINVNYLFRWLKQESLDAHNAKIPPSYSRNGESINFDRGVFKGREEMANEIIKILNGEYEFEEIGDKLELREFNERWY